MKLNYIFILTLLIISSCSLTVNSDQKTIVKAADVDYTVIEEVMKQQTDEWNKGNIDGFMKGYWNSPDLKFITSRGVTMGYDSMAAGYKRSYNTREKMGNLTFTNLVFYTLDSDHEIVQCTGRWNVAHEGSEPQAGVFSLIFRRIDNDWKIIVDHTW